MELLLASPIQHEITAAESRTVCAVLHSQHIDVDVDVDERHVVHVRARRACSTVDEVRALRAFAAVTDCRLAWHPAAAR